jgi:hypothetical protein
MASRWARQKKARTIPLLNFNQTWPAILSGDKTESTHLVTGGAQVTVKPYTSIIQAVYLNDRLKWRIGDHYAIQPAPTAHALYWKPSATDPQTPVVYSSLGISKPPPDDRWIRAEIILQDIDIIEMGEMTAQNVINEGYYALGGNHGGPMKWFASHWRAHHGQLDKAQLVFRLRFELKHREVLYGIQSASLAQVQRFS